jgi:hypothetical protein
VPERRVVGAILSLYLLLLAPLYADTENRAHALMDALYARRSVTIDVARFPTVDLARYEGEFRTCGAPGQAFAGLIAYAPVRFVVGHAWSDEAGDFAGYVAAIVLAAVLPMVAGIWALARLARRAGEPEAGSLDAARVLGFGTLLVAYAPRFLPQSFAAGVLALALLAADVALRNERPARAAALAGLAAGFAAAAEYPLALALGGLGLLLAASPGTPRERLERTLGYALGAALPVGLVLVYHAVAFGGPFVTPYRYSIDPSVIEICSHGPMGYVFPPSIATAGHLLAGPRSGLLVHAPAVAPALAGAALTLRQGDAVARREALRRKSAPVRPRQRLASRRAA